MNDAIDIAVRFNKVARTGDKLQVNTLNKVKPKGGFSQKGHTPMFLRDRSRSRHRSLSNSRTYSRGPGNWNSESRKRQDLYNNSYNKNKQHNSRSSYSKNTNSGNKPYNVRIETSEGKSKSRINMLEVKDEAKEADINMVSAPTSVDRLLTIKGHVHGKEGLALLDSGSTVSVISLEMVKALNIEYGYSNQVVNTIINKSAEVLGITEELEVNVKGHSCMIRFYVLDNKYELLLGLNWFAAVGAGIGISKDGTRQLTFFSEKYD